MKHRDSRGLHSALRLVVILLGVPVLACYASSGALSFNDISFQYIAAREFGSTEVSLPDLAVGEIVLLKTPGGYFSKLRIGFRTSTSEGTTVYSVQILEGVTYSPNGDEAVHFTDAPLVPGQAVSALTGRPGSEGHIVLIADVSTLQVTRVYYRLRAEGGSRLARCLESRPDGSVAVKLTSNTVASLYVNDQFEKSIYGALGTPVRLDPGPYTLRISKPGYKDWTVNLTVSAGDQRVFTIELVEATAASFTWQPSTPNADEPVAFDASGSMGRVVQYEWDWDGDGRFDEMTPDPQATHTFLEGKYHPVTLRVTDEDGDADVFADVVLVDAPEGEPPVVRVAFSVASSEDPYTVGFDASESYDPDGSIETYRWDFGDGKQTEIAGQQTTVSHAYQTPGIYQVSVQATDNDGLSASDSLTVDIQQPNDPPIARFTWEAVLPDGIRLLVEPRAGDRIRFDASESRDPDGTLVKFEWDWTSDGMYDQSTTDLVTEYQFPIPGSHRVTLRVVDDRGTAAETTQTLSVGERQVPAAEFAFSPASPSTLDIVQFTDRSSDPDGSISRWQWIFGDGGTASDHGPTHQYAQKGAFTVSLTVTDNDGLTATSTQTVTVVNLPPEPSFTIAPPEPVVGQPTSFDASTSRDRDGTVATYAWDFTGDGVADAEGRKQAWTFSSNNEVTVTLSVTDHDGATRISQRTLFPNQPPVASFTWEAFSPEGTRLLVEPRTSDRIRFDASKSHDPDGTIVRCEWDWTSDGTYDQSTTEPVTEYQFSIPGSHRVTLRVVDDRGAAAEETKTLGIREKQPPKAGFTVAPSQPSVLDDVAFIDTSIDTDGRVVAWAWDFGDGSTLAAQHPTHRYNTKRTFDVSLTVTDDDGQTSTFSVQIPVVNLAPNATFVFRPDAVRPGRDVQFDASDASDPDGEVIGYAWDFNADGEIDAAGPLADWTYADPGPYTVTLSVTDNDGAISTAAQTVTVEAAAAIVEPAEVWAVAIGISDYREVKDLEYAQADAEAFTQWLLDAGIDAEHIVLLLDEESQWPRLGGIVSGLATLTKVRAALDWLRRMAQPDDLVFVFFAGHGYQGEDDDGDEADGVDEFLVLYDAEKSALEATSLRDDEFGRFLDRVESDHVMVVFDSCHSGGQSRSLSGGSRPLGDGFDMFNDFSLDGKLVLAAAKEDQEALEHEQLGHGLFTHFLLRGLKGEADLNLDYRITADELFAYVSTEVERFAKEERGRKQTPEMTGRGSVGIVLARTNRPPDVAFSVGPDAPYACGVTFFTDHSTDDTGIASWSWNFGDGTTSQELNPVHTYDKEGLYTVILTVVDKEGATSTTEDVVVVAPPGQVTTIAGSTIIISLGSINGVGAGDKLEVIRTLQLADGTTITERKAIVEVIEVLDVDRAACRVVEEALAVQEGDLVQPIPAKQEEE